MDKLIAAGKEMGLQGDTLLKFVQEQQVAEREERAKAVQKRAAAEAEREAQRVAAEAEKELQRVSAEAALKQKQQELELKKVDLELARIQEERRSTDQLASRRAKVPKLPTFIDEKDELDNYLLRFERFAYSNNWDRSDWATRLSALLTGRALEVYSRLSEDHAVDYDQLKKALLCRYELTEEGYHAKFRKATPSNNETSAQFIVLINNYVQRWVEMASSGFEWKAIRDLLVKEQFLNSCPRIWQFTSRSKRPRP